MASGRKVIIEFLGQDKSLSSTSDKAGRSTSRLGDTLKNVGKVAAVGLAAGAVVAGKALFDMTKAAAEDQAGQAKLALALKNTAGATDGQVASVEDWITAQGKALGVADDELRPALARLAQATGDVGKAQELTRLAMDVSAGSGKSLEAVSTALMKAQNGQVSSLARLGINVKNAKGETISFEQAQKRMAATFKGQAEKNAETLSGKMARLKLALSEAGEEIGAKLIPVVTRLADWFINKALPAMEAFGAYLQAKLPPIFEQIRAVIAKFSGDGSGKLGKFMSDVKGIFNNGVQIVTRLWAMFGKNIVGFLKGWVKSVVQILKGVFQVIKGIFKVFSGVLTGDWKKVWSGIKDIFRGVANILVGLVKNLWNTIKFAFKNAGVILKAVTRAMWDGIKALAREGADFLVDKIREIPGKIKGLVGKFKEAGGALIKGIADGIKNAAGFASDFAGQIWLAVKGAINAGIDDLNNKLEFDFKVKGVGITVNAPDIGHLAKGTNNWRGGLAVVGEQGPELVNLQRGAQVIPHGKSMGMMRGLGGGDTYNFYISGALDEVAVARRIEQLMVKGQRATGRPYQFTTV